MLHLQSHQFAACQKSHPHICKEAVPHTIVKFEQGINRVQYMNGARIRKLQDKEYTDATVYKTDYHNIANTLYSILDYIEKNLY